ncbi:alpha,alpha-trehalose-phosphate synthase (UDP-forming) [Solimonas marina]|uniref:Trehalose-6-phosphate synthase n=1 Tax=Solimonas marina TaxID=2714601 RepID=A0A969W936_9GAMM|nr:alpha,alpha-trehalose-phosphate synthase (UDP-forming) [Solimonas marina]NKF22258.1 alpha,alpha-trehalose-phosphate synthase (UDP-forming) [Solimonas marina]
MSRLVVVSNRVGPLRGATKAGGLAVALADALRTRRGLWFGWSGEVRDGPQGHEVQAQSLGGVTRAVIDLTSTEHDDYYNGFANRCLWPLFHFRLDLATFDRRYYEGYQRANQRFAQALTPLLRDDDLIWVHDYHLLPFGETLRDMGARQRLGFFLHIPWPVREILTALPHHEHLVRALFSYDLVGFQTEADLLRFQDYVLREAGGSQRGNRLYAYGRSVIAQAYPIGIDTDQFATLAASDEAGHEAAKLKAAIFDRTQIVGVDRLDYTKGLPERFQAYEKLLELYPEAHGQVSFLQIAPTSRGEVQEYIDIRHQLDALAGHINGRFAQLDWTPLRYINRAITRRQLAGIYRASRIGLVTPLRDGMNLVAKEYVAAQDPDNPGVLVLSRFAGSAKQMAAALIVNPYDPVGVAEAIETARHMPLAQRRDRHRALMHELRRSDVASWSQNFLTALDHAVAAVPPGVPAIEEAAG